MDYFRVDSPNFIFGNWLTHQNVLDWSISSIDPQSPLVNKVGHFWDFDRFGMHGEEESMVNQDHPFKFMFHPAVPILIVVCYLLLEKLLIRMTLTFKPFFETFNQSLIFHFLVSFHNWVLAIYSFITFINVLPLISKFILSHDMKEMVVDETDNHHLLPSTTISTESVMKGYCDVNFNMWNEGFGWWVTLFYLSKFYEFCDTLILIIKFKKPSFLQLWHHSGIVMTMWVLVVTQIPSTVIKIFKPLLTSLQLSQFIVGMGITLPLYFVKFLPGGESCNNEGQAYGLIFNQFYVASLIPLFVHFYVQSYTKKQTKKQK